MTEQIPLSDFVEYAVYRGDDLEILAGKKGSCGYIRSIKHFCVLCVLYATSFMLLGRHPYYIFTYRPNRKRTAGSICKYIQEVLLSITISYERRSHCEYYCIIVL
jgi:hypothetical protein